jgi:predicted nucleic acid-binding protein
MSLAAHRRRLAGGQVIALAGTAFAQQVSLRSAGRPTEEQEVAARSADGRCTLSPSAATQRGPASCPPLPNRPRFRSGPARSALTQVEFCSALGTKVGAREIEANIARRLLDRFRHHVEERRYRLVAIQAREYAQACDWVSRFSIPLRTVDALHLAAAFSAGLLLVTADQALARCAEHFGVECRLIS